MSPCEWRHYLRRFGQGGRNEAAGRSHLHDPAANARALPALASSPATAHAAAMVKGARLPILAQIAPTGGRAPSVAHILEASGGRWTGKAPLGAAMPTFSAARMRYFALSEDDREAVGALPSWWIGRV